jgi:hypothetical protein
MVKPAPCSLCTVNKPVPASTMELFGVANVMALWTYKAEVPSSSNTRTAQVRGGRERESFGSAIALKILLALAKTYLTVGSLKLAG